MHPSFQIQQPVLYKKMLSPTIQKNEVLQMVPSLQTLLKLFPVHMDLVHNLKKAG